MAKKTETPQDPKKPTEDNGPALRRPGLDNPALLFLLVAAPLLFGVLYAFVTPESPIVPERAVQEAPQAEVVQNNRMARSAGPLAGRGTHKMAEAAPGVVEGSEGSGVSSPPYAGEDASVPAPERVSCLFDQYVGEKPSPEIEAAIKAAGKMIRVLPPGSNMTMDYSTDRVNLELDDQGVIQRVWCG